MTTCTECLNPCEMHGLTFCATCHKHEGQCDFGDCEETEGVERVRVHPSETRPLCSKHQGAS